MTEEDKAKSGGNNTLPPLTGLTSGEESSFSAPAPKIEGYEIRGKLGEAGQGQVWRALQLSTQREVALKVPRTGLLSSKKALWRFEREVELAARLKHANIARIHDSGVRYGQHYYAMDLIEGMNLDRYVKKHDLPQREILELMRTVCQAVQYAHQNGVIHRDLKPSNITVSEGGHPYIVDFGLAKNLYVDDVQVTVSIDGEVVGTLAYMSPEQAAGHTDKLDTRTDVYSLGAILFALLTDDYPHDLSGSRLEVLQRIAQEPVRRPRKMSQEIDKDLEALLLKALDSEPDRRYSSAGELAKDIDNYLKGVPLIAGPQSSLYQIQKFVRRNGMLVGSVAAILVVLVAGSVISTIFAIGQAKARGVAERQTKIAAAVNDFLNNDLLASVDPEKVKGKEVTVRSVLDAASENIKGKFEGEPLIEASIRTTLGVTYWNLGEYEAAEPHLERALEIHREKLGELDPATLTDMYNLGLLYTSQGHHDDAEPLLLKALEGRRRVLGEEHPNTLWSVSGLADLYMSCGLDEKAEPLLVGGLETGGEIYRDHPGMLEQMNCLAKLYIHRGQYAKAEPLLTKLLEVCEHVLGEDHPETLKCMGNLSLLYHYQHRYDEAEQLGLKTVEAKRRVLGEEHPETLISMGNLAGTYTNQGRYDKAEPLHVKALEIRRRVLGEEHPQTLNSMVWLARLYKEQGRYDDAEALLVKTLEGLRRVFKDNHPGIGACMRDLADIYSRQTRYKEAEPLLISLAEVRSRKLGDGHPKTVDSVNSLIKLYEIWDKPEKAEEWRAKLPDEEGKEK